MHIGVNPRSDLVGEHPSSRQQCCVDLETSPGLPEQISREPFCTGRILFWSSVRDAPSGLELGRAGPAFLHKTRLMQGDFQGYAQWEVIVLRLHAAGFQRSFVALSQACADKAVQCSFGSGAVAGLQQGAERPQPELGPRSSIVRGPFSREQGRGER